MRPNAYSALTEKTETNSIAPTFKVNNRVRITKYKIIFKFLCLYTDNWSREIFTIDSVLNTNPWYYKIKDLNGQKIIGSFIKKSYYPEPDSHLRNKVKIVKLYY